MDSTEDSISTLDTNMDDLKKSVADNTDEISSLSDELSNTNEELSKINVYVGEDGKIHYTDKEGADTVLPFSSKPVLIGSYSGNRTMSLSSLGYPDATADNFLVVITSVPSTELIHYYQECGDYYNRVGLSGSTPSWSVSNGILVVTGMYVTPWWKNTYQNNSYTITGNNSVFVWNLYYIG